MLQEINLPSHNIRAELSIRDDSEIIEHLRELSSCLTQLLRDFLSFASEAYLFFGQAAHPAKRSEVNLLTAILKIIIDHRHAVTGDLGGKLEGQA